MMKKARQRQDKKTRRGLLARVFRWRFLSDDSGVTAVEFGLLAIPFFAIIGAILETALVFLASQIMDAAVDMGVRQLRTGQIQNSADNSASHLRSDICGYLFDMFDCNALKIDVEKVTDFASATTTWPLDTDTGDWKVVQHYQPGVGSDVIMVKVYYKWPTMLNFFNFSLADTPDGKRLLSSVRVYKNEPF